MFEKLPTVAQARKLLLADEVIVRPFTSPGRGGRVVTETDMVMLRSDASSRRDSVDLPRARRRGHDEEQAAAGNFDHAVSLDVLNLLAHLVDHRLEIEADGGERPVDGLGTERVGLAVELLRQEVELAADGIARGQQLRAASTCDTSRSSSS